MKKNRPKHIIFVPPDGTFKKQDFSIQRVAKWLYEDIVEVKTTLIYIESDTMEAKSGFFNKRIVAQNRQDIISIIKDLEYDIIFHRSWMTCYEFAAELTREFQKVIINIKDWNFASKDVYEFLYPECKDYEAIEYIFKNAYIVLSHFTEEQSKIWAKEYKVTQEKFVFFPEYCNKSSFHAKPILESETFHLVYAGNIPSTVKPEDYFPAKAHLRSVRKITRQGIYVDFVLPQKVYEYIYTSKKYFEDYIFENFENDKFSLVKGKALDSSVLDKYHYGFFELEATGVNEMLYKYAITSKFAFYLEAGLPILINSKFVSMSNLVDEHGLGIVFSNNEVDALYTLLEESKIFYDSYLENIKKFRRKFIYTNENFKRIIIA